MFSNGRKTIGLFIFNPHGDFQKRICRGMAVRAEQLGYNLAIFTSFGKYGSIDRGYEIGEIMIYDLPQYDKLAGIVLAFDTFSIPEAKERILEHIEKSASCPVVSLREPLDGVNNILINETVSMDGVMRHIIEHHGKKDIAMMTGQRGREDAEARLECFRKTMAEYGYPVRENRMFYGDFWRAKGPEACDWFCQDGTYPEAILCANDYMALAVIDELSQRGIRVPEDVLVTGYDGVEEGEYYDPSLSTVCIDFMDMASKAVDLIHRHQDDDEIETLNASSVVIPRASCGCLDKNSFSVAIHKSRIHKNEASRDNLDMQFNFLTIDLSGVRTIEELHKGLSTYIYNIEKFQNYFICLRDDIEGKSDDMHGYTEQMHVRVAFRDRENLGDVDITFDRHVLLPKEFVSEEPQCYFFIPLHYLDNSFGYEAYSFHGEERYGKPYVRWNISVSNAIYNIRFCIKMNDLISELENMYIQDVLTGLYNRRGFEKYARMQFSQARAKDSTVCVIGIDMDGLKPINDIYGHHEGDSALRAVGYAIQEASLLGQIGARIGGDEFEVIFPCDNEEDVREWIRVFEKSLDKFNKKSGKPYEVHASWGYELGIPTANDTIASYMRVADDKMYKNKIVNKSRRKETFR